MLFAATGDLDVFEVLSQDPRTGEWHLYRVDLADREGRGVCNCQSFAYSPYKHTYWACKHICGLLVAFRQVQYQHLDRHIYESLWRLTDFPHVESEEWREIVAKKRAEPKNTGDLSL